MITTYIYTLTDPITNKIRYIGKTNNISQRYKAHLNKARKHQIHKANWIKYLKDKGLKPIIEIIDIVLIKDWIFWETYWISQFKTWGYDLINYTNGGEGCTFSNQTSFKKGHIPWNNNTIKTRICKNCNNIFKPAYNGSKQVYCSKSCGGLNSTSIFKFSKNSIPWNKEKTGYSTKRKGTHISEEVKIKISNTLKGKPSKRKRKIKQFDMNNVFIREFTSITEAKLITKIKSINNALKSKSKIAGGYIWQYWQ